MKLKIKLTLQIAGLMAIKYFIQYYYIFFQIINNHEFDQFFECIPTIFKSQL
jgi:hypothetical protein